MPLRELSVGLVLVLGACGGAPLDRHAAYGRIQVEEARIAHASACEAVCAASEAIAREASLLDEADADTRADRAARTCASCGASR